MQHFETRHGRAQLESADHAASVRLDFDEKAQRWLLTAFKLDEAKLRPASGLGGGEGVALPTAEFSRAVENAGASPTARAMRDLALERAGIKAVGNVGDPALHWDAALARGERPKRIFAVLDHEGTMRTWDAMERRAQRQMERLGIANGRVIEVQPATPIEAMAADPRLGDAVAARFSDPAGGG